MRVVIDTCVWVSAVLNRMGAPARVLEALEDGRFSLIASEPLLEELAEVLARPRLAQRYNLTADKTSRVLGAIRGEAELAEVRGTVRVCRDPDDDMVIETAITGGADVLVSRDDDLKRAPEVVGALAERGIRVLTVQHFLDVLATEIGDPPAEGQGEAYGEEATRVALVQEDNDEER